MLHSMNGFEVAVIGMSGKFPGAEDLESFWSNITGGVETISFFSDEEVLQKGVPPAFLKNPNYVKAFGLLQNKKLFDPTAFGFTAQEAEVMDPQIRIGLECAMHALEDGGYHTDYYKGSIGVFAGATSNFSWEAMAHMAGKLNEMGYLPLVQKSNKDFLATQIAHRFNLTGPCITLNTACSTSLVAIHLACRAIIGAECEMALAGGVTVSVEENAGYIYQEGMILSPDGHCRAFDSKAKGTVGGEGAGMVLLKNLEEALKDGDNIYAIIKSTAVNNDGIRKVGFSAPSVEGQAEVIKAALAMAEIDPETITYVEAHGTGTELGDPVEIEALKIAFATDKKQYCGIGSLKSNFGHLDAAAGVANFIKAVLSIKNRQIPPTLHYTSPNPKIRFENTPFYVNDTLKEWRRAADDLPLSAGVSSFGIGGTNAHAIIQEAPVVRKSSPDLENNILVLSAANEVSLQNFKNNLKKFLENNTSCSLSDVAYTLQLGRKEFPIRHAVVASDIKEAVHLLSIENNTSLQASESPKVIMLFPGQGAQYIDMGKDLYSHVPRFKAVVDKGLDFLKNISGFSFAPVLFSHSQNEPELINHTQYAQPLIFLIEYALHEILSNYGIKPYAMIGHSLGEFTAACIAEVFTFEECLTLIYERGRLMQTLPAGEMISIFSSCEEVKRILGSEVNIAAINGPQACVVSGSFNETESWKACLEENKILYKQLHTSHAFHSASMDPILAQFKAKLEAIVRKKPKINFVSNLTGTWITDEEAISSRYWVDHLRNTVLFYDGAKQILPHPNAIYLEVGPGKTLISLLHESGNSKDSQLFVNLVRHPQNKISDVKHFYLKLAELWSYGQKINWNKLYNKDKRNRLSLPKYSFDRQEYWLLDVKDEKHEDDLSPDGIENWFYSQQWKRTDPLQELTYVKYNWILIGVAGTFYSGLKDYLSLREERFYELDLKNLQDNNAIVSNQLTTLLQDITTNSNAPFQLIFLPWFDSYNTNCEPFQWTFEGTTYLLNLIKSINKIKNDKAFFVKVVTQNLYAVVGNENLNLGQAPLPGLINVINQEFPNIVCHNIDVEELKEIRDAQLFYKIIFREFSANCSTGSRVAFRNNYRWMPTYPSLIIRNAYYEKPIFVQEGLYFITGGLGGIGSIYAAFLAQQYSAKLFLTGRSSLPEKGQWNKWILENGLENDTSQKISFLQNLESLGAVVEYFKADISDESKVSEIIKTINHKFGKLNGVIHAAGTTSGRSFNLAENLTAKDLELQFKAKVQGTMALYKALQYEQLDFCILMSSLSGILGGLTFSAYASANAFMDSFVHYANANGRSKWTSIAWDGWNTEDIKSADAEAWIKPEEGVKALTMILSTEGISNVFVSTQRLEKRLKNSMHLDMVLSSVANKSNKKSRVRPLITTNYEAPRSHREKEIAVLWEEILGIEKIGIQDDFFELGGDSLKGLMLLRKMHEKYKVYIPTSEMFQNATILNLINYMEKPDMEQEAEERRIILLNENGENNLFAFPPLLGDGIIYKSVAKKLEEYTFYSFNYIEEDDKILQYRDLILQRQSKGPYVLIGFSAGGSLAFETAVELEKMGEKVSHLILFDSYRKSKAITVTDSMRQEFKEIVEDILNYNSVDFSLYRELLSEKSGKYFEYINEKVDQGLISSDIIIISAVDHKKNKSHDWEQVTNGKVQVIQGYEKHDLMLHTNLNEKNSSLLKEILEEAFAKTTAHSEES